MSSDSCAGCYCLPLGVVLLALNVGPPFITVDALKLVNVTRFARFAQPPY
jgi:hypothetical protein